MNQMSNEVPVEDFVGEFDDDMVEFSTTKDVSICMGRDKKVQKHRTSEVWNFFDPLPSMGDDKVRAKCKFCGTTYLVPIANGTGNLKWHIQTCPRRDTCDVGQVLISGNQGSMFVSASKFCPRRYRELLVASVIKHDLPFEYVEYDGVREMMQCLRSDVPLISRNIVKADLIKMHLREKQRVKSMLNVCPGRICLTSDLWTSLTTDGYMCLTAHFIDKNWVLTKKVLNFSLMPSPHNGVSLCEKMYNLLQEWGIETKVFSITLDNASSNDVFVGLLKHQLNIKKAILCEGEFFHLCCCGHILNVIVQDGLKEIDSALQKIRDSVKYVRGSPLRKQNFLQAVNQMSLDSEKGLRQDVPTRWNSTYLMLETAIHYQRAFSYLEMIDSNYKHCPTALEWEKATNIYCFLTSFYHAACEFSGTKYPTANLYFPVIFDIYETLKEEVESEDEYKRLMATQMLSKFEKYWSKFSVVLAIAIVLDPRYKLQLINFCYMKLYGVTDSREFLHVREKLFSLFMEYSGSSATSSTIAIEKHDPQKHGKKRSKFMEEYFALCRDDVYSKKNQLELYLNEPLVVDMNAEFDVLSFWKVNEFRYPKVAAMARDILSIPVSTVASESIFRVGGHVIDQYRSSLKPDIVEALVCTKDWIYEEQEHTQMKLDELEDILTTYINSSDIPNSCEANFVNIS